MIYIIYGGLGKLLVFILQKFPFTKLPLIGKLFEGEFLKNLFSCDLCLGVWVYWILAILLRVNILDTFEYIPVFSEFCTAVFMSFVVWLISEGWNTKFRIVHIELE